jgi:hypothetical protein
VSPWSTACIVLGCIGFACAGIGLLWWVHDRGAKVGRAQGYAEGYQEGFGAAREIAELRGEKWWSDADRDVERVREEMWREGL